MLAVFLIAGLYVLLVAAMLRALHTATKEREQLDAQADTSSIADQVEAWMRQTR